MGMSIAGLTFPYGGSFSPDLPLRGRGTAAVGGGGRGVLRKRVVWKKSAHASPERGGGPQGRRGFGLTQGQASPKAKYWAV